MMPTGEVKVYKLECWLLFSCLAVWLMWPVWPASASCFSWFVLMSSYGLSFPADLLTATGTRNSIKNSLWKLITEEREDISLECSFLHVLVWLRYFDKFNPPIHFFSLKSLLRPSFCFFFSLGLPLSTFPIKVSVLFLYPRLPHSLCPQHIWPLTCDVMHTRVSAQDGPQWKHFLFTFASSESSTPTGVLRSKLPHNSTDA